MRMRPSAQKHLLVGWSQDQDSNLEDFPSGPVVKTLSSIAGGHGSYTGVKAPHADGYSQKLKKKKKRKKETWELVQNAQWKSGIPNSILRSRGSIFL